MKRIFAAVAVMAATVSGAFAWTNNFGFGAVVPVSKIEAKTTSAKDISEIGGGISAFYMGFTDIGFTFKTDFHAGAMTTKDVNVQGSDTNVGSLSGGSLGLGWTLVKSERVTLSLLGMFGVDSTSYTDKKTNVGAYKYAENTVTNVTFNVGGDVYAAYKIGGHFGVFANVGVRYVLGGLSMNSVERGKESGGTTTVERESYDNKYIGGFSVQPSLGVCWRF